MSWMKGLTGGMEELLNKLDQSAAHALTNDEQEFASGLSGTETSLSQPAQKQKNQTIPLSFSEQDVDKSSSFVSKPIKTNLTSKKSPAAQRRSSGGVSAPATPTSASVTPVKKSLDDQALFDFLNSSEPTETNKKRVTPKHSRQSSTSSIISNKNGNFKTVEAAPSTSGSGSGSSIVHIDSIGTGTVINKDIILYQSLSIFVSYLFLEK